MRNKLSDLLTAAAVNDPRVVIFSGDHGYALFDAVRKARPNQFVNVGVAEQGMIGIAAGMAKSGFLPIVYGLSAFLPIRVLEQIKLDLCISKLPVLLLGDGAGLVYSTLGSSHQCAEDIAALRPMPDLEIFSPADAFELESAFESIQSKFKSPNPGPVYLRLGKSDRPAIHAAKPSNSEFTFLRKEKSDCLILGTGSMASSAVKIAGNLGMDALSINRIKPIPQGLLSAILGYRSLCVLEEHNRAGGLFSAIAEGLAELPYGTARPRVFSYSLQEKFAEHCGSHDYALSEHGMKDSQIEERMKKDLR